MKGFLITIFNSDGILTDFIIKDTFEEAEMLLFDRGLKFEENGGNNCRIYKKTIQSPTYSGSPYAYSIKAPLRATVETIIICKASIVEIQDDRDAFKMMVEELCDKEKQ